MIPNIANIDLTNIDSALVNMSMGELLTLWQNAIDYRNSLPGGGGSVRGGEITRVLDDHIIPAYQAWQGNDVIAYRAANYASYPTEDNAPLDPAMVALVTSIRATLSAPSNMLTPAQQSIKQRYSQSIPTEYSIAVAHGNAATSLIDALVAAGDISIALQNINTYAQQFPGDSALTQYSNYAHALYSLRAMLAAHYPNNIKPYDSGYDISHPLTGQESYYNPINESNYHPNVTEQLQTLQSQGQQVSAPMSAVVANSAAIQSGATPTSSPPSPAAVASQAASAASTAADSYMSLLQGGAVSNDTALNSVNAANSAAVSAGNVIQGMSPKLLGYAAAAIAALFLLHK